MVWVGLQKAVCTAAERLGCTLLEGTGSPCLQSSTCIWRQAVTGWWIIGLDRQSAPLFVSLPAEQQMCSMAAWHDVKVCWEWQLVSPAVRLLADT